MELNRLKRILRDRWLVVLVIALLGAIGAWAFTGLANQQRESRWQAEAAITFTPIEGQTIDDLGDRVNNNLGFATLAAQDLLAEDPTSTITADLNGARLLFTAYGGSREEANAKVEALKQAYFEGDPLLAGQDVEERLQTTINQAAAVEQELKALEEEITPPVDPAVRQEITNLDLRIQALTEAMVTLTASQAAALPADRQAITEQLNGVIESLNTLQTQRASLPSLEPGTPTVEQQLRQQSLQNSLTVLQAEYQTLFMRLLGISENTVTEPTNFTDLTAGPGSGPVNAAIGFAGGLAVALFALIFINNTRKAIWLPEDLGVSLLADVPGRRTVGGVGPSWYDNTGSSPRKSAIQGLRSGVEARLAGTSGAIAISGNRVPAATVHALVTDLAVSMASAGSSVLLVDADLESDSALAEYQIGGPSLSAIL